MIYTTHLHELAANAGKLNEELEGKSLLKSIVALVEKVEAKDGEETSGVRRLYKIVPGLPHGRSYALEIARQHRMSFDQIMNTLESRGVLR